MTWGPLPVRHFPCSLCLKSFNTEGTEPLSDLRVSFFLPRRARRKTFAAREGVCNCYYSEGGRKSDSFCVPSLTV